MLAWWLRSSVGLALVVSWGALARGAGTEGEPPRGIWEAATVVRDGRRSLPPEPTGRSDVRPFPDADGEAMSATERTCDIPRWGESDACAAFALASGASVEIELKEVKDADGKAITDQEISFRLYGIKTKTNVDPFNISPGSKHTYENKTAGALDLVIYAKGKFSTEKRTMRFTYEKK